MLQNHIDGLVKNDREQIVRETFFIGRIGNPLGKEISYLMTRFQILTYNRIFSRRYVEDFLNICFQKWNAFSIFYYEGKGFKKIQFLEANPIINRKRGKDHRSIRHRSLDQILQIHSSLAVFYVRA